MKRANTIRREELIKQLNWLERKNKRNSTWDKQVKLAFEVSGSFSFDELIVKDQAIAEDLVETFK
jgi:hypothetical protein